MGAAGSFVGGVGHVARHLRDVSKTAGICCDIVCATLGSATGSQQRCDTKPPAALPWNCFKLHAPNKYFSGKTKGTFLVRISSRGVGVFHLKGWAPKSSACPLKPMETKLLGGMSWDFCRDIPGAHEKFEENIRVQFLSNISELFWF